MTLPGFQDLMLPVLKYAATREEHSLREVVDFLIKEFSISPEDGAIKIPSGSQPIFYNRVGWARTYLKQAGLLEQTRRSYLKITERGKSVLKEKDLQLDMKYLEKFPEYLEFRERTKPSDTMESTKVMTDKTPEEILGSVYDSLTKGLSRDVLNEIYKNTDTFFQELVVKLLVKMGYGGSGENAGRVVGRVGDEGIDGIIDEDKLGLDNIYIQAKKWFETPVGRPEIQKFVGALEGKRAHKGIFITASKFTNNAREYAKSITTKVVLIDGDRLADLMIEYNVGVTTDKIYEVKKIDTDFFQNNE